MSGKEIVVAVPEALPQPAWWSRAWSYLTAPQFVYKTSFLLGLLLVLAYLVIPAITGSSSNWALAFVKELGFAYVIASILGFSIEEFNKLRHLQHDMSREEDLKRQAADLVDAVERAHAQRTEVFGIRIAQDVIQAAYAATVPRPVLDAFTKFVLQARRIRIDFALDIDLYPLDEVRVAEGHVYNNEAERARDAKCVLVTYISRWIDENVTAEHLDMIVPVEIMKEGPELANFGGLKHFEVDLVDQVPSRLISASTVADLQAAGVQISDTPQKLNFEFCARAVPPKHRAKFCLKYQIVQDVEDQIILMSIPPCVDAVLKVRHSQRLAISVSSIHSEPEVRLDRQADWRRDEHHWKLATSLLPSQGFVLNWMPVGQVGRP